MALITVKNVSFYYEKNMVVENLSFEVNAGDYLCVVGENGSGKSTLIKGLLRLKQPESGEIAIGDGLKANEVGYLPQQTAAQKDFPGGVYEVVLSGRLSSRGIRPFYTAKDKQIAKENMELLNISDLANRCYRELSGGQQQRVLLARALCATRKLILLDEPVSGLDPLVTQEFYGTVAQLNRNANITVIMVSHDIQSAVKYATHILHLQNEQAFFGKTEEYLRTTLAKSFIGGAENV
jgi:ABC-type Mn/Zn transport systems, ATPase component